jgi:hypothetical protein
MSNSQGFTDRVLAAMRLGVEGTAIKLAAATGLTQQQACDCLKNLAGAKGARKVAAVRRVGWGLYELLPEPIAIAAPPPPPPAPKPAPVPKARAPKPAFAPAPIAKVTPIRPAVIPPTVRVVEGKRVSNSFSAAEILLLDEIRKGLVYRKADLSHLARHSAFAGLAQKLQAMRALSLAKAQSAPSTGAASGSSPSVGGHTHSLEGADLQQHAEG